jgi:NTE family protein
MPSVILPRKQQQPQAGLGNHTIVKEGKTALVLSAGGLFGAYQAGVWEVLSGFFQPDIVVGASIGSINGYLISSGCEAGELQERWLALQPIEKLRWRLPDWRVGGILDDSILENTLQDLCSRWRPRTEFGVVATELPGLQPKLFRWPDVCWGHIAASCAVPVFLKSVRIGGSVYADGGLVDPLPLWAALEMGATRIVAVNLLRERPLPMRGVVRLVQTYASYRRTVTSNFADVVEIAPAGRLGTAQESMCWRLSNTKRWIEQGRQDARVASAGLVPMLR